MFGPWECNHALDHLEIKLFCLSVVQNMVILPDGDRQ